MLRDGREAIFSHVFDPFHSIPAKTSNLFHLPRMNS
jgi:hypothetical protein